MGLTANRLQGNTSGSSGGLTSKRLGTPQTREQKVGIALDSVREAIPGSGIVGGIMDIGESLLTTLAKAPLKLVSTGANVLASAGKGTQALYQQATGQQEKARESFEKAKTYLDQHPINIGGVERLKCINLDLTD